jgi:NAD(P)-dependent dehydrogenase (short-subunit alcohol dehydrogenase family)
MSQASNQFQLQGMFLVTGGTRGIGRAISSQFGRGGACVIANYLRDEKSALALRSIAEQEDLPIEVLRADLTTPEGLKQIEARVKQLNLPLCGLVHCAATGIHRKTDSLTGRHLDWTFALNVRALFELVSLFLPLFDRRASILAISSIGAIRAVPYYTAVGASKGALEALVRHLAAELAPRGIRANVLTPGAVATDAWKAIPDAEARLADAVRRSPIERLVTVEELALCAQFLCSPAASGINGQTLVVDGGTFIMA